MGTLKPFKKKKTPKILPCGKFCLGITREAEKNVSSYFDPGLNSGRAKDDRDDGCFCETRTGHVPME